MKGNRMLNEQVRFIGFVIVLAWSAAAWGQAWVSFVEDPARISADPSVINDLPCDPNCTGECGPVSPGPECENVCACACEKDMAVGDLDGRLPLRDDLVIVRIQPFETQGGVSNLLFMNENGTMVDRTADLAPCFADPTQDRDVVIKDIDPIPGQVWPDVITATTYFDQPRVYMNLGNDAGGNWRGLCLCYDKETDTCHDASYLTTHAVCYQNESNNCFVDIPALSDDRRIDPFTPAPLFCSVAVGDVNMDGCDDLYFVDYDNTLKDRLLFNIKNAQTDACTGFFDDVTVTPSTRLCPNGPPCFYESGFGTGARIIDIDLDGKNDIVKSDGDRDGDPATEDDEELSIIYNDPANVGHFNVRQVPQEEPGFGNIDTPYMFAAGDMNRDGGVDLYVVRARWAVADRFLINKCFQDDPLPPECDRGDGTVQFADPRSVQNTSLTNYNGGNVALIDLDGDTFPDVLLADVDVPGNFCTNTLRLLKTTVIPEDPMNVTVSDPSGSAGCAWNTNITYDFAVMDINGDSKPDLWSGHGRGNQVFLWESPVDCDADGVPDRCAPAFGAGSAGGENPKRACCLEGFRGGCIDTFEPCCDAEGGLFFPTETCATVLCPTTLGPQPGG